MTPESDAKFEEKLTCGLENDMRNLADFQQSTRKSQNWDFYWVLLSKVEKVYMSLKFTGELCVMTVKNDPKFEKELTCQFKVELENLKNLHFNELLFTKVYMFELRKYRGVMFYATEY